ncbi:MAG: Fibronectin type domain protein [Planctomycetota bacterium]|nr:Fibronectin type domain protein [Planctomycetota bacterium]
MLTWPSHHRRASSRRTRRANARPPRPEALEPRSLLSAGGGFTQGGIAGTYYADETLSGTPAFVRQDDRIDFTWPGGGAGPGGSNSPGFAAIGGGSAFSARWMGQVVPAFSETYTFAATFDEGARLSLRPAGSGALTTLIDDWTPAAGPGLAPATTTARGSFGMVAGQTYDLVMEYHSHSGDAAATLAWSSPSTPTEVVGPLSLAGLNMTTYSGTIFADAMKSARDEWGDPNNYFGKPRVVRDANGWPLSDATSIVWDARDPASTAGTYLLYFTGRASVSTLFNYGQFSAGGTSYGTVLPAGAGYDPATNSTTALVRVTNAPILYLTFKSTQATPSSPLNSGVKDVQFMRPTTAGSSTPTPLGTLVAPDFKTALTPYSTERWLTANFDTTQVNWSDRVLPSYQIADYVDREAVWEDLVMFANETGKDLYITIPMNASADYVTKLAQTIRYGTDGVNPYTSIQAHPAYPGLQPNLKLYVEWSNETWNWAFGQGTVGNQNSIAAVQQGTPEGQILNFDGQRPYGDFRRWTALKTVEASDAFRSVFSDPAMGDRVRMLLEYQYDNAQNTAIEELGFIDNYFNNADGKPHVATPHPVGYYLWGAGAAAYFGAPNGLGTQSDINFTSPGFESATIGQSWSFAGNAGLVANSARTSAAAATSPGTLTRNTAGASSLGYKFTVGPQDIAIYNLGRWVAPGDTKSHVVRVLQADTKAQVAWLTVNTAGVAAGQYAYASVGHPVMLKAGTTYYLLSDESSNADPFYDQDSAIAPTSSGITILGAASATILDTTQPWNTAIWKFADGAAGSRGFGPVDIKFTTAPDPRMGFVPDAPEGVTAAFIGDTGSISQAVNFPSAGTFALQLSAANKAGSPDSIRIFVDSTEVTPNGTSYKAGTQPWSPGFGAFGKNQLDYYSWGTAPFPISSAGFHTVRIVGTGSTGQYTFLDNFQVTSAEAIFASGVPGRGEANGQPQAAATAYQAQLASQAKYAQFYGLQVVAYEGGWSVGGDAGGSPLQNYAKYADPRAGRANLDSLNAFAASGGVLYCFGTYDQWQVNDLANAASYPLQQSIRLASDRLPAAPTNGIALPATLTTSNKTYDYNNSNGKLGSNGYLVWDILVPADGLLSFTISSSQVGSFTLIVDGQSTSFGGAAGTPRSGSLRLSRGVHSLKIRSTGGQPVILGVAASLG